MSHSNPSHRYLSPAAGYALEQSNSLRCHSQTTDACQKSVAESLLQIGRLSRFLVRHRAEADELASDLGVSAEISRIACALAAAPDCLKLRALVEDWDLRMICAELQLLAAPGS